MTQKQTALSQLARLALNNVSDSPPHERAKVCRWVAEALAADCPDLAELAQATAQKFSDAFEIENDLISQLNQ